MTVVVGYIPNPLGEAALEAGIAEARLRAARLVVVNTTRADRLVDPRYAGEQHVQKLRERLAATGLPHEVRRFTSPDTAADDLVGVADEVAADLLVIGIRRRSAVGKLILGSSAQTILVRANCPVLAVKGGS